MTTLTSSAGEFSFGSGRPTTLASMLINTLKDEALAKDLARGDLDCVRRLATAQRVDGVGLLQIMLAHPELDERLLLPKVCVAAQEASGLPLYIDSANVEALARTLDAFPYKPVISVNGEEEKLASVLPLVKAGGCAVIGLTLDKSGIPATVDGRLAIAATIRTRALEEGIADDDILLDPLVLAAGATDPTSLQVTLEALREIKQRMGSTTFLGIDNCGFGMPQKDLLDLACLLAAIPAGLDIALMEAPTCSSLGLEGLSLLYGANFIGGRDPYAKEYLRFVRQHKLVGGK